MSFAFNFSLILALKSLTWLFSKDSGLPSFVDVLSGLYIDTLWILVGILWEVPVKIEELGSELLRPDVLDGSPLIETKPDLFSPLAKVDLFMSYEFSPPSELSVLIPWLIPLIMLSFEFLLALVSLLFLEVLPDLLD